MSDVAEHQVMPVVLTQPDMLLGQEGAVGALAHTEALRFVDSARPNRFPISTRPFFLQTLNANTEL